ncbi:hypothetical protein QR680_019330 [Steinernema hermaphroditum]|uniref:Uncharacterized protein n=1 Tax=Steinernema hermaphroditum TaxID=289476 RepID=A0AA39LAY9_9BILA|nr:hypothetical protein QR680_019330 [Steinernema hermaphroditum]
MNVQGSNKPVSSLSLRALEPPKKRWSARQNADEHKTMKSNDSPRSDQCTIEILESGKAIMNPKTTATTGSVLGQIPKKSNFASAPGNLASAPVTVKGKTEMKKSNTVAKISTGAELYGNANELQFMGTYPRRPHSLPCEVTVEGFTSACPEDGRSGVSRNFLNAVNFLLTQPDDPPITFGVKSANQAFPSTLFIQCWDSDFHLLQAVTYLLPQIAPSARLKSFSTQHPISTTQFLHKFCVPSPHQLNTFSGVRPPNSFQASPPSSAVPHNRPTLPGWVDLPYYLDTTGPYPEWKMDINKIYKTGYGLSTNPTMPSTGADIPSPQQSLTLTLPSNVVNNMTVPFNIGNISTNGSSGTPLALVNPPTTDPVLPSHTPGVPPVAEHSPLNPHFDGGRIRYDPFVSAFECTYGCSPLAMEFINP